MEPSLDHKYFSRARPADVFTDRCEYIQIQPTSGSGSEELEFNIPASQAGMIDLSESFFVLRVRVDAGTAPAANYEYGTSQWTTVTGITVEEGYADVAFKSLRTFINGIDVSDGQPGFYPWTAFCRHALTKNNAWVSGGPIRYAYASNELSIGDPIDTTVAAIDSQLYADMAAPAAVGWGAANSGYAWSSVVVGSGVPTAPIGSNINSQANRGEQSAGYALRQMKTSRVVTTDLTPNPFSEWICVPQASIWRQGTCLPSDVDIRVTLTKSAPAFYIHQRVATASAINWSAVAGNKVTLFLKRRFPSALMRARIEENYAVSPMAYQLSHARTTTHNVGLAATLDVTNLLNGPRPDVVCIQFVNTAAVAGHYQISPFASTTTIPLPYAAGAIAGHSTDFVSSIYVVWGSRQFPLRPITATAMGDIAEAYANYLACAKGGAFGEETPMLTPDDFRSDKQLFCFNLRPDEAAPGTKAFMTPDGEDLSDRGSLEVHAVITRGVRPLQTTMIVNAFSSATLEIDAMRQLKKIGF